MAWDLPWFYQPIKHFPMIIKLDTSVFRIARPRTETKEKTIVPLTKEQWIKADRIVIISMFIATIAGAILF